MWMFTFWYLTPPTSAPVPLLLSCGSVEFFGPNFIHPLELICDSSVNDDMSVWSQYLPNFKTV